MHTLLSVDHLLVNDEALTVIMKLLDMRGNGVSEAIQLSSPAEGSLSAVRHERGFKEQLEPLNHHPLELFVPRNVFKSGESLRRWASACWI
jgi:hypothetical protein